MNIPNKTSVHPSGFSTYCQMRSLFLSIVCLSLFVQTKGAIFKPVAICINGEFVGQSADFEPVNYRHGVTVDINLVADGIISIDQEKSTITAFVDDKTKDLLKLPDGNDAATIGAFPKVNDTRTAALFNVYSSVLPSKDARTVTLSGTLLIKTANTKDKTTTKHIVLTKGTVLAWGTNQFLVDEVNKADKLVVSLRTDSDISDLIGISVVDSAGKESIAICRESSSMDLAGKHVKRLSYEIDAIGETFDVAIEFWKDVRNINCPFMVKVGLGL